VHGRRAFSAIPQTRTTAVPANTEHATAAEDRRDGRYSRRSTSRPRCVRRDVNESRTLLIRTTDRWRWRARHCFRTSNDLSARAYLFIVRWYDVRNTVGVSASSPDAKTESASSKRNTGERWTIGRTIREGFVFGLGELFAWRRHGSTPLPVPP